MDGAAQIQRSEISKIGIILSSRLTLHRRVMYTVHSTALKHKESCSYAIILQRALVYHSDLSNIHTTCNILDLYCIVLYLNSMKHK
jgi:hypothetical protein